VASIKVLSSVLFSFSFTPFHSISFHYNCPSPSPLCWWHIGYTNLCSLFLSLWSWYTHISRLQNALHNKYHSSRMSANVTLSSSKTELLLISLKQQLLKINRSVPQHTCQFSQRPWLWWTPFFHRWNRSLIQMLLLSPDSFVVFVYSPISLLRNSQCHGRAPPSFNLDCCNSLCYNLFNSRLKS